MTFSTTKIGIFFLAFIIGIFFILLTFKYIFIPQWTIKKGLRDLNYSYKTSNSSKLDRKIDQQIQEAAWRKQYPPSSQELEIMKRDELACFHNDDCRMSSEYLGTTCNGLIANKYYCQENSCSITQMACVTAKLVSDICINNKCTIEVIEENWTMFPYSSKNKVK